MADKPEEKKSTITSMSVENRKFPPSKEFTKNAYIKSMAEYKKIYKRSIDDMEGFWAEQAAQIDWYKKWDKVLVSDFKNGNTNGSWAENSMFPTTALTVT